MLPSISVRPSFCRIQLSFSLSPENKEFIYIIINFSFIPLFSDLFLKAYTTPFGFFT